MLGWLALVLGILLIAAAVPLALAGLGSGPALLAAFAAGGVGFALYRTGRERVVTVPYERLGVDRNEDGTVGTPGADHERATDGADYEPRDFDDAEEWPWNDPFWYGSADGRTAADGSADGDREDGGGAGPVEPTDRRTREACEVLGVDPDADEEAVRRAYRERVKEVHPDHGGDPEAFRRVRRAYEHLRDGDRPAVEDRRAARAGPDP